MAMGDTYKRRPNFDLGATVSLDVSKSAEESLAENPRHRDILMTKNLQSDASGFDAYSSCYRTSRKRQELPCDFGSQSWCTIPGNSYPWHAVRRFVHENQGLMRRMYGDETHISVLRAELESNDIEFFNSPTIKDEFRRRYSKDIDGTKEFVKMFIKDENRKYFDDLNAEKSSKVEKIQKSIDDTSNNVLYQSKIKNSKGDMTKMPSVNGVTSKPVQNTSSTSPSSPLETTIGKINSEATTKYGTMATTTTGAGTTTTTTTPGEGSNSTTYETDPTIQPIPATEGIQFNQTTTTSGLNDTQFDDGYDYESETAEPPTTTNFDYSYTTEAYFFDEEIPKDKSEAYDEVVEETETVVEEEEEQQQPQQQQQEQVETPKEPVSPQPSPMIRLKGINACPVKEEVVAPFWANNTRGEVLALLNLYPFEQYVHWEKCMYEHKQMFCREGCRCEQQYRLHRLLAYDPNNECRGIFSDWFRFPSCCVCKCYDLPMEFRLTSRSPRFQSGLIREKSSIRKSMLTPEG
ncbi:hypothetical protein RUM44_010386 [Polyplax serrata]|uniref:Spaetzle domain-containing protein n=1 Tax=Polyplax serrata TaxID=468196 RepID=A0ABR1AVD4_POLSC